MKTKFAYGFKTHGVWFAPWAYDEKGSKITTVHDSSYLGLDAKTFDDVLKCELDVPEYRITPKRIASEFGYGASPTGIPAACMDKIVGYYKFRKSLYDKIKGQLLDKSRATYLMRMSGADEVILKYDIPPEANSFSCEDPDWDSGQTEAWVEASVWKEPS